MHRDSPMFGAVAFIIQLPLLIVCGLLLLQRVTSIDWLLGIGIFGSFILAALLLGLLIVFQHKGITLPPQLRWLALLILVAGWVMISYTLNSLIILLPFLFGLPALLTDWRAKRNQSVTPKQ